MKYVNKALDEINKCIEGVTSKVIESRVKLNSHSANEVMEQFDVRAVVIMVSRMMSIHNSLDRLAKETPPRKFELLMISTVSLAIDKMVKLTDQLHRSLSDLANELKRM